MDTSARTTATAISATLAGRGAPYAQYSSMLVSWDDVSRGTVGDSLSCWGANITDTYLNTKDGASLFTVRPDNWNEKLGVVRASDVAMLTGNCDEGARRPSLRPITLDQFLAKPAQHGAAYTGLSPDVTLSKPALDDKVSIRFQTVFLPLPDADGGGEDVRVQFAAEAYSYSTLSDADPRNLILLASSQGIAFQADGAGAKRVLHHGRDNDTGPVKKFWLEAEATRHKVGQQQVETKAERAAAQARGKATSETVGIRAMGTRFNALLTAQIPLSQQQPERPRLPAYGSAMIHFTSEACGMLASVEPQATAQSSGVPPSLCQKSASGARSRRMRFSPLMPRGVSSAARVSRGDAAGDVSPLSVTKPERHDTEHVTVTVVVYHCVQGGVPAEEDVVAAIDELERFYDACSESGRLADAAFEFMTQPLTVNDVLDIYTKITTQPPHAV